MSRLATSFVYTRLMELSKSTTSASSVHPVKDPKNKLIAATLTLLILSLIYPVGVLAGAITYWAFRFGKVNPKSTGIISLPVALVLSVPTWFLLNDPMRLFLSPIFTWWGLATNTLWLDVWGLVASQVFMIGPGMIIGAGYSWLVWARWRDKEDFGLKPSLLQKRAYKKNFERSLEMFPPGAVALGVDDDGEIFVLDDVDTNLHIGVFGGSGVGKTTTLMKMNRGWIKNNHAIIFIDLKGDGTVIDTLRHFAQEFGKEFHLVTFSEEDNPELSFFDPLQEGSVQSKVDQLMKLRDWTGVPEIYKTAANDILNTIITIMSVLQYKGAWLEKIVQLTEKQNLEQYSRPLFKYTETLKGKDNLDRKDERLLEVAAQLRRLFTMWNEKAYKDEFGSTANAIKTLTNTPIGRYLGPAPEGRKELNLDKAVREKQVVLFSLSGNSYRNTAGNVANLITMCISALAGRLSVEKDPQPGTNVLIDEFTFIKNTNVETLLSAARVAGFSMTLSTQQTTDITRAMGMNGTEGRDTIIGNMKVKIFHRAQTSDEARYYETYSPKVRKETYQDEGREKRSILGSSTATRTGNYRTVIEEVPKYTEEDYMNLGCGECIVKVSEGKTAKVKISASKTWTGNADTTPNAPMFVQPLQLPQVREEDLDIGALLEEYHSQEESEPLGAKAEETLSLRLARTQNARPQPQKRPGLLSDFNAWNQENGIDSQQEEW